MPAELLHADPWEVEPDRPDTAGFESQGRLLGLEWADEIEPQLNNYWLIKKALPQQGLGLIYGHPGSGKSFLALDFGMHVALGRDWNGLRTRQGVVIYVAAEGQSGLRNRIAAFKRYHRLSGPIPLALIPASVDLYSSEEDREALNCAVQVAAAHYGQEPALIVVDTLSKTLGAGKENTDDLAVYVANCQALASKFGCCVLLVHHRPKDAESTEPRGHGSLKAGVDTTILIDKPKGKATRARITKQKDSEERELLRFELLRVELGCDDDGDPVESCVLVPAVDECVIRKTKKIAGLPGDTRIVYDELRKTLEAEGVAPPRSSLFPHLESVPNVVDFRTFSKRAMSALRTTPDRKPDTIRKAFTRGLSKLEALGLIALNGDYVWLAANGPDT